MRCSMASSLLTLGDSLRTLWKGSTRVGLNADGLKAGRLMQHGLIWLMVLFLLYCLFYQCFSIEFPKWL
jgi:hypothetical protein